jgi:hypothetical protein
MFPNAFDASSQARSWMQTLVLAELAGEEWSADRPFTWPSLAGWLAVVSRVSDEYRKNASCLNLACRQNIGWPGESQRAESSEWETTGARRIPGVSQMGDQRKYGE